MARGGGALTTAGSAAARCACAGIAVCTAMPLRVHPAGAMTVTRPTTPGVAWMTMPGRTTGGALTTTAGAVPIGAGTMMPGREPGGGGTKTPTGPIGGGPTTTPGRGTAIVMSMCGGGGANT
jgi:hypothetical protein